MFGLLVIILFTFCDATIEKRALVYPVGGTYKVITAIAIPIEIGTKQALSYSINFQFQYVLPQNFSQLDNDNWFADVSARRRRMKRVSESQFAQQKILYMTVEKELNRLGFKGRECLRSMICELAANDSDFGSLYDQLAHILLIPRPELQEDPDFDDLNEALQAGKFGADCKSLYEMCSLNNNIFGIIDNL